MHICKGYEIELDYIFNRIHVLITLEAMLMLSVIMEVTPKMVSVLFGPATASRLSLRRHRKSLH